eukprot:59078-Hanusia_phi.AAC.7
MGCISARASCSKSGENGLQGWVGLSSGMLPGGVGKQGGCLFRCWGRWFSVISHGWSSSKGPKEGEIVRNVLHVPLTTPEITSFTFVSGVGWVQRREERNEGLTFIRCIYTSRVVIQLGSREDLYIEGRPLDLRVPIEKYFIYTTIPKREVLCYRSKGTVRVTLLPDRCDLMPQILPASASIS